MKRVSEALAELVDSTVKPWVFGAVAAVLAALSRQVTDSQLIGSLVLPLVTAGVVLAAPLVIFRLVQKKFGVAPALVATAGAELVLLLFASVTTVKSVGIDDRVPADAALAARLTDTFPLAIRKTGYNELSASTRPRVLRDGHKATYVVIDFLWTKRDGPDRTYEGRVVLEAIRRPPADSGLWTLDPFTLKDMSLSPKQGWIPYLLGWAEAPLLFAEAEYFTAWATARLVEGRHQGATP